MPTTEPSRGDYRSLALVGTAVGEMVTPILIGVWLDGRYGWSPWGLAAGAVLGIGGGLTHLILIARRADKPAGGD